MDQLTVFRDRAQEEYERLKEEEPEQVREADEELEQRPSAVPLDGARTLEEKAEERIRETIRYARDVFQRKLYVLRKVMRQWALTRHVPPLTEAEAEAMTQTGLLPVGNQGDSTRLHACLDKMAAPCVRRYAVCAVNATRTAIWAWTKPPRSPVSAGGNWMS